MNAQGLTAPVQEEGCRTRCLPFRLSTPTSEQDLGPSSLGGLGQETVWGPPDKRLSSGAGVPDWQGVLV